LVPNLLLLSVYSDRLIHIKTLWKRSGVNKCSVDGISFVSPLIF
jgi:hypothetical protein